MADVMKTAKRVEELTADLALARAELKLAIKQARVEGESVSEMARRLNISRTRVQQLLK